MMQRRSVILGGLSTIACGCGCAHAGPLEPSCLTDDAAVRNLVGNAPVAFAFSAETVQLQNGSGDRDFDHALAISLAKLSDMFGVLPGFGFYDDAGQPNAFASPSKRLGRADGAVLFGKTLLRAWLQKENGAAAIIGICAHEFGHIAQIKHRVRERLIVERKVKRLELHADFCAGYFAGRRKLEKRDFPAANIALGQYYAGDVNNTLTHHGTPDERGQAVVEGFQAAYRDRKSFDRAFNDGVAFVGRFPA